jgi:protein TonB
MHDDTIKWFVILSVAVHATLLVSWKPPPFEIGNSGRVVQLAMTAISSRTSTETNRQTSAVPAEPERSAIPQRGRAPSVPDTPQDGKFPLDNRVAPEPAVRKAQPQSPRPRAVGGREAPAAGSTDRARQEADRHLRKSLYELVTARLSYPAIARRKGWQGTVQLELHIEPDGQITRLRIDATSGYPLLDQAAVRSLQLASVPHAGRWLNGRAIDIVIPVEYRLLDG